MDYIMRNYPLESDSIDTIYDSVSGTGQSGGQTSTNKPTGGFPPIYLCEKGEKEELFDEEDKKKREYATHKTAVSIKDIMEKRRKTTPFIALQ
jgi:hypothetical protein